MAELKIEDALADAEERALEMAELMELASEAIELEIELTAVVF